MVTQVLDKGYVRLLGTFGSDLEIVNDARVSYDKESQEFTERDERLLRFLLREGHYSPLRGTALKFEIYAPLMIARQWYKYHVASNHTEEADGWNESSRRYVTEEPTFYITEADQWRSKPENSKQGSGDTLPVAIGSQYTQMLMDYVERGVELYERAMEEGICAEQARAFLPAYNMYVRWRWTTSLQGAMHMLHERLAGDAQHEITQYAKAVSRYVRQEFPRTYAAFEDN